MRVPRTCCIKIVATLLWPCVTWKSGVYLSSNVQTDHSEHDGVVVPDFLTCSKMQFGCRNFRPEDPWLSDCQVALNKPEGFPEFSSLQDFPSGWYNMRVHTHAQSPFCHHTSPPLLLPVTMDHTKLWRVCMLLQPVAGKRSYAPFKHIRSVHRSPSFTRQGFEGERCTSAAWNWKELGAIREGSGWWMTYEKGEKVKDQTLLRSNGRNLWAEKTFSKWWDFLMQFSPWIYYKWAIFAVISGCAGSVKCTLPRYELRRSK